MEKRRTPSLSVLNANQSSPTIDTPLPSASVTNKPGTQSASLYHTCRAVLDKLLLIDGMTEELNDDATAMPPLSPIGEPSSPTSDSDPLSKLWSLCRRGTPLCRLFNALEPAELLSTELELDSTYIKAFKHSTYKFIAGCRKQLNFEENDVFMLTDLYGNNTNGFVKVVNTINKIVDLLETRGLIEIRSPGSPSDSDMPKDTRDKVVQELLDSERKYVQDLELLQKYMHELHHQNVLSDNRVHELFGNFDDLVDFQRRFLVKLEEIAERPSEEQRFGALFQQAENAFSVYMHYCSNFDSARAIAQEEIARLERLADILNPTFELPSMMIKPVQRICKYPLLLSELIKSTHDDCPCLAELETGRDAIERVAKLINEARREHENRQTVEHLKKYADEWKGHSIESYGKLLLQEKLNFTSKKTNREFKVYFFEKVLLFCKEHKDSAKNKLPKANTISIKKKRRGSLQPKGLISTNRIVEVRNTSDAAEWTLTIIWHDEIPEEVTLGFRLEESLNMWEAVLVQIKNENLAAIHYAQTGSTAAPLTPSRLPVHNDTASFIDEEDDEEESCDDEDEQSQQQARSRSNSITAQLFNGFGGKPKLSRNHSSDAPFKPTLGAARPYPGMNLSPLPRSSASTSTTASYQGEYNSFYPASPPPSHPSSPTHSSRILSASGRRDVSPLVMVPKGMGEGSLLTPSDELRQFPLPPVVNRSQSHSVSGPSDQPPLSLQRPPLNHTRLRSQSSPNIRKHQPQWDKIPEMPALARNMARAASSPEDGAPGIVPRHGESPTTPTPRTPTSETTPLTPGSIKIRLVYNEGIYVIVTANGTTFSDLWERVERKIRLVSSPRSTDLLRIKYQDEDGDFITINSDDDVQMAFDCRDQLNTVELFVSF